MDLLTALDLQLTELRCDFAALKVQMALRKLAHAVELAEDKAGFKPDQPRDDRGRWSGGGGTTTPGIGDNTGVPTRGGHHFVDKELYKNLPLRPETRRVFEQAVTGPLNVGPHGWSKEHQAYNDAVDEHFKRFLTTNGIRSEEMTPDQARKFVDELKRSSDSRIRGLNMRIYMREIMYWLRRVPRGND